MSQLTVHREISSPPEAVWRVLTDFGGIHRWNPNLKHAHLLEGSHSRGLGARRHCLMSDGRNYIREEVIAWEEGRSYTVSIYEGTMPLERAEATLAVAPSPNGATVSMTMRYVPKYGWLGWLFDWLMLRWMMRRLCGQVLRGLDQHVRGEHAVVSAAA